MVNDTLEKRMSWKQSCAKYDMLASNNFDVHLTFVFFLVQLQTGLSCTNSAEVAQ